jgi:NADPH:quinone reductase-like Zn-dependent oxidoreductase
MKAVQISGKDALDLVEVPDPVPGPGEVVVDLRAAALNHRDVWIRAGQYAGLKYPCIPGSDGAGTVAAVGDGADPAWKGRAVIINPAIDWGDDEGAQGARFSILGLPRDGTLAERIAVPAAQLTPKPEALSWEEAAALPLSGLTAWRALFSRARLKAGERVLITGIGGGGALAALQFAVAHGAEAWVTSSSAEKLALAGTLGARGGFLYTRPAWAAGAARAPGLFDVILDSAGGEGFNDLIDLAAPGGRIVVFGATRGNAPAPALRKIFWRQISLLGSTMGSPGDWAAMIAFTELHRIRPVVASVFPLALAPEAFALMERGGQCGKIVLRTDG